MSVNTILSYRLFPTTKKCFLLWWAWSCDHKEWNHYSITVLSLHHQRKMREKLLQRSWFA